MIINTPSAAKGNGKQETGGPNPAQTLLHFIRLQFAHSPKILLSPKIPDLWVRENDDVGAQGGGEGQWYWGGNAFVTEKAMDRLETF